MFDLQKFEWDTACGSLHNKGYAIIPGALSLNECENLRTRYDSASSYRSTISMERFRFGKGEYRYYAYPLPTIIETLRENLYKPLAPIANQWMQMLGVDMQFPAEHSELLNACREKGQTRPTPLILHYREGGYNTLHQDLYGDVFFPFQVLFLLSDPEKEFTGGEFILVEQLPRAQSRATVLKPQQGDAIIFTTNFRPVSGTRGYYKARMKHGISVVTEGERYAMGIIFHDAR